jgi:hypothetical protein
MVNSNRVRSEFRWQGVDLSGMAVGERCVVRSKYDPSAFDRFLTTFGAGSKWPVGREVIHALAYKADGQEDIELSVQRESVSPEDLALMQEALKQVRIHISSAIWPRYVSEAELSVIGEFAFVELPTWLESSLTADIATVAVRTHLVEASTVSVSDGTLSFGPEHEGSLASLQRFLAKQYKAAREGERLDRTAGASAMPVPWILVALLLGTWFVKLGAVTLLAAGVAMTMPIGFLAWQARAIGWRLYLLRPGAVTAVALYSICLFGLAYGVCAIRATKAEALGNSFLIATSMGLAGGVVGENLTGAALRVAHVQLLLFLGGLSMLVARVLRIDALLKDRQ